MNESDVHDLIWEIYERNCPTVDVDTAWATLQARMAGEHRGEGSLEDRQDATASAGGDLRRSSGSDVAAPRSTAPRWKGGLRVPAYVSIAVILVAAIAVGAVAAAKYLGRDRYVLTIGDETTLSSTVDSGPVTTTASGATPPTTPPPVFTTTTLSTTATTVAPNTTTTAASTSSTTEARTTTTISIRETIRQALDRSSEFGPMPADEDYRIARLKVVGSWAGVSVLPPPRIGGEISDALLKLEGGRWKVVIDGPALTASEYEAAGAPADLAEWLEAREGVDYWSKSTMTLDQVRAYLESGTQGSEPIWLPDHLPSSWAVARPDQGFPDSFAGEIWTTDGANPWIGDLGLSCSPSLRIYAVIFTDGEGIAELWVYVGGDWPEWPLESVDVSGKRLQVYDGPKGVAVLIPGIEGAAVLASPGEREAALELAASLRL